MNHPLPEGEGRVRGNCATNFECGGSDDKMRLISHYHL